MDGVAAREGPQELLTTQEHRPNSSYLICATQRSGSHLLCRALSDTGIAGHPEEYFPCGPPEAFAPGWKFWEEGPLAREHGVGDRRSYLQLVYRLGSSANGVFGAKLMANNLIWVESKLKELAEFSEMTLTQIFGRLFPRLRAIHLVRRDLVRQAVSWARAAQDGVWVVSDTEPARPTAEPAYDYQFIANLVGLLEEGETDWRRLYTDLDLTPHEVLYEDLVDPDRYEDCVRGVLAHLGLDASTSIPRPRTRRQADGLNDEWATQFEEDRRRATPRP